MPTVTSVEYYTTTQSDTFDLIAYDLYGDEYRASDIVGLNPEHAGELVFDAGVELRVPAYGDDATWSAAPWRRPA